MGASTSLERRSIAVEPGGEATCSVLVRNSGKVVDQFTITVLGAAERWSQVEPAVVNLLPAAEATVVVRFRPPRTAEVAAGEVPFGIRVNSREDPDGSVVEEGTLDIGPLTDVRIELAPRRAWGRLGANFEVVVDNGGNRPMDVQLFASDPDQQLRFRLVRSDVTLEPGTTAFVGLRVRPFDHFLRGPDRTYPFHVAATGAGPVPISAEGAMIQRALLPKWLMAALALLLAALIALVALWFTIFKPTIQSAARDEAVKQVQGVSDTANAARSQADFAEKVASGVVSPRIGPHAGQPPAGQPPAGQPPAGQPPPGGQALPPLPPIGPVMDPIDFRIATDSPRVTADNPGQFTDFPSNLPANKTVMISDVVLQNPLGDSGILRIVREVGNQQTVLLEVGLNNFRDLDYHFVEPWRFKPGEKILLAVNCANPPGRDRCVPSASFSGRIG